MSVAVVLLLAFAIDRTLGEPPNRFHPVCWMGSLLALGRRTAPATGNALRFFWGMLVILAGGGLFVGFAMVVVTLSRCLPIYGSWCLQAILLKTMFSVASLAKAGHAVRQPLERGELDDARQQLSFHLVSRPTADLDSQDITAAAIESVAENTSDSFVAPLLFYSLAGLPGVFFYRWVNTADAMLGYRTDELEWLGKFAARLDDCLNWVPARLTAIFMLMAGVFGGWSLRTGFYIWRRDSKLTASPNAGHPMSMASGLLRVSLEKKGHYVLGHEFPKPSAKDLESSIEMLWYTSFLVLLAISTVAIAWELGLEHWGT